jgi:hypothetical protein
MLNFLNSLLVDSFVKSHEDTRYLCETYSSFSDWRFFYIVQFLIGIFLFIIISLLAFIFVHFEQEKDWNKKVIGTVSFSIYSFIMLGIVLSFGFVEYSRIKQLPVLWGCEPGVFYDNAMILGPLCFAGGVLVSALFTFIRFHTLKKHKEVIYG